MDLKELTIEQLVELLNKELKEGLSVGGICKKYNASKGTIINKLSRNNYKFDDDIRQYKRVATTEEQLQEQLKQMEERLITKNVEIIKLKDLHETQLKQINEHVQELINENAELKEELERIVHHGDSIHKLKNERGAGRKAKFTVDQVEQMKQLREAGKSIKAISLVFKCSVGLVHKLINEQ